MIFHFMLKKILQHTHPFSSMKSGRDSRALRQVDDANDFNDDFTLLDGFSRVEAEGNVAEVGDAKEAKGLSRDDELYGGYGGYGTGSGSGKGKIMSFY